MNYRRVIGRNLLSGDYHSNVQGPVGDSRPMIRGDLRRLEIDQRDDEHLRAYALRAGIPKSSVKQVLDDFFGEQDVLWLRQECQVGRDERRQELRDAQAEIAKLKSEPESSYQHRVNAWMQDCFGPEISADIRERVHRFVEEALELAQSKGCTADEARLLVEYVFNRPVGEPRQEVGGVMVTLAALCNTAHIDVEQAADDELARCWTKIAAIREKQRMKPKFSPLPQAT